MFFSQSPKRFQGIKTVFLIILWLFILIFPPIYATHSCRKAISFFQFEKAYESTKIVAEAGELIESLLAESSMGEEKKEQILLLFDLSNTLVDEIEDMNNKFNYKGIRNHIYANAFLSLILEGFSLGWITRDFLKSKKKKVPDFSKEDITSQNSFNNAEETHSKE